MPLLRFWRSTIMNGQMMNYKKYNQILKTMPQPISLSQIPKVKIDYKGLKEYAQKKGISPAKLTDEEKNKFISGGKTMDWIRKNAKYNMNPTKKINVPPNYA